jgi:hypothetical protein
MPRSLRGDAHRQAEPTIDSIEVAEFESHAALKEWLNKKAPAFTR